MFGVKLECRNTLAKAQMSCFKTLLVLRCYSHVFMFLKDLKNEKFYQFKGTIILYLKLGITIKVFLKQFVF